MQWSVGRYWSLTRNIFSVRRWDCYRNIQLPVSGYAVQATIILLRLHHLYPHLHDGLRVLDVLLAGPQVSPGQGGADHHNPAGDVHHHLQYQQFPPACGLHQGDCCNKQITIILHSSHLPFSEGHWCMEQHLCFFREASVEKKRKSLFFLLNPPSNN